MTETNDTWPAGATWVFQGTVAEDATGGTHIASLTVTPGQGNEITLQGGLIITGATATAQTVKVAVTDGTNVLQYLVFSGDTTSSRIVGFPTNVTAAGTDPGNMWAPSAISGTMQLVLSVTTTAISVTQTFSVVCRLKTGQLPTATLADAVGTPALTTNTNKVF